MPRKFFSLLIILLATHLAKSQNLLIPGVFGNHMVLQRNIQNPLWGKCVPGAEVTVRIDNQKINSVADAAGNWKVYLPKLVVGKTYTLYVESGDVKRQFTDILAGDVFFAGGQSNMQFELSRSSGGKQEVSHANFPSIRLFKVAHNVSYTPLFDFSTGKSGEEASQWQLCIPETARDFSSVAYYFAKRIHMEAGVPIGIIDVAWGGTPIEAHTSLEGNKSLPYHRDLISYMDGEYLSDTVGSAITRTPPNLPASVFNAMIHPLIPFGISGFIWYQGEQNANYPLRYREQFINFIQDIRVRWQGGYIPFYFVQIPGIGSRATKPSDDFWSILRESQSLALRLPNTGMVVSLDLDEGILHPLNKKLIGDRLAMLALKNIYGKNAQAQSPIFRSYAINRDSIEISFDYAGRGLVIRNDTATGFSIAGEDKRFYWAEVRLKSDNIVLVYSDKVKNPKSVRYAWGENPPYSLFNKDGFPASPFRTDHWPVRPDGWWEY